MTGTQLILKERARQLIDEGWDQEHDDRHDNGALTAAASTYALFVCDQLGYGTSFDFDVRSTARRDAGWPWDAEWWKPSPDPIRNLVKAGALIAAEIDRLQRKT